jgi:hypothetical protein
MSKNLDQVRLVAPSAPALQPTGTGYGHGQPGNSTESARDVLSGSA